MADDTISRVAAIETVRKAQSIGQAHRMLVQLPSAQPTGTNTVQVEDCISRQAAIDALDVLCQEHRYKIPGKRETYSQYNEAWQDALDRAEGAIGNLPSAQPECEDAVSRFEVLRLIDYSSNDLNDSVDNWYFQGKVKELPSVTPKQPGWIPCVSGKFPEESGTYTVTAYDGATKRVTYAKYQKRLMRWELTGARAYWRVLAWQPKPQPWEGGQDNGSD